MKPDDDGTKKVDRIGRILFDSKAELASRFRALFTLKNMAGSCAIGSSENMAGSCAIGSLDNVADSCATGSSENMVGSRAIEWITKTLLNDSSPLLKHECAYCLGQIQNPSANSVLELVLRNKNEHPMVRHEAGEALAAIGSIESLPILKHFSHDEVIEVAQTCQLGVQKIELERKEASQFSELGEQKIELENCRLGEQKIELENCQVGKEIQLERKEESITGQWKKYSSVDPTPAFNGRFGRELDHSQKCLMSDSSPLFEKYQALFTLRNIGTEECVKILGESLMKYRNDEKNNLLKHEIAYVFGQMQHPASVPYLKQVLEDVTENEMVRHEAAEALGSVANDEATILLDRFKHDHDQVVRESIQVALDMNEYEKSRDQFNFIE